MPDLHPSQKQWFASEIVAAAIIFGLQPSLVEAVCWQESSSRTSAYRYEPLFWARYLTRKPEYATLNPARVSASYGLMQIMFPVARELGFMGEPEELFAPAIGLEWGCRKLAHEIAWAKGDLEQALAAYNGGRGGNVVRPFRNGVYATQVLARKAFLEKT